jgi:tetratricopeptide (TPR) repeat protein
MMNRWFGAVLIGVACVSFVSFAHAQQGDRIALIIGNAKYPDADQPLAQPVNDARALADELRRNGFEVDVAENLTKEGMRSAIDRLYGKIKSGSSAVLFFSGFGIQTGRQTYMIPVNAQIWTESEVRRDGIGIDAILAELNARGAGVKLAILDASRRNPFERRFRGVSLGLAPVTAPRGTLVISAAAPGTVVNEGDSENSLFVRELLKEMRAPGLTVEEVFNRTRIGVSRASKGEQVPWISSSLVEDFYLGKGSSRPADQAAPLPEVRPPPQPDRREADADVKRDFDFADRLGTRKGWEDFLNKHKSGTYPDLARDRLARLDPPSSRPSSPPPDTKPDPVPRVDIKPDPIRPEPVRPEPFRPEPVKPAVKDALIEELDRTLDRNPNDGDSYFKRGLAYAQKAQYREAIRDFDQVIRLNPKDAEAFNNRCWVRAMIGDLQVALRDCNESLRLKPNFVDALDSRGLVNLKIGLPSNAIADYNAALRINPKHASALFGRGKAKLQSGDTAGGNADINAAKAINRDIAQEFEDYGIR